MMSEIDAMLDQYERELRYFVVTRDELEPVLGDLTEALASWLASRSDGNLLADARRLRADYIGRLERLRPLIADWVAIRGSGESLWGVEPYMTEPQAERFADLNARELVASEGRERFDALHARAKSLMLLYEEATPTG